MRKNYSKLLFVIFLQMEFGCKIQKYRKKTTASKAAIRFPMIGYFLFYGIKPNENIYPEIKYTPRNKQSHQSDNEIKCKINV
jgi:hypothetical protein